MSQHSSLQSLTSSFIYNHTHLTYSFRAADNHIGFTIFKWKMPINCQNTTTKANTWSQNIYKYYLNKYYLYIYIYTLCTYICVLLLSRRSWNAGTVVMLRVFVHGREQTSWKVGTFAKIKNQSKVFLEMYIYSCCQSLHCLTKKTLTLMTR